MNIYINIPLHLKDDPREPCKQAGLEHEHSLSAHLHIFVLRLEFGLFSVMILPVSYISG